MDTATAKELLQSSDIDRLRETAQAYLNFRTNNPAEEEQILKLQVLLWSRILLLQKQQDYPGDQQAASLCAVGTVWMRMGHNDRAIGQLQKALELQSTGLGAVKTLQLMGQVHVNSSNYGNAVEYHQRAIAELVACNDAQFHDLALAYGKLASVFEAKSDFAESLEWLDKAYGMCDKMDCEATRLKVVASILSQRGTLQEKLGDYKSATESLRLAHDALVKTKGKDHEKTKEIEYLLDMASDLGG